MQEVQLTDNQIQEVVVAPKECYAPSSVEKKRAVVMYMLFGIMMMMGKQEMNVFEYYHLKQSIGRWLSFVVFFIVFAVLLFIPVIKLLGIIPLFALIVILGIFIKQAWDGKYITEDGKKSPVQVFASVGGWLLGLFEINPHVYLSSNEGISVPEIENLQAPQDMNSQPMGEEPLSPK